MPPKIDTDKSMPVIEDEIRKLKRTKEWSDLDGTVRYTKLKILTKYVLSKILKAKKNGSTLV